LSGIEKSVGLFRSGLPPTAKQEKIDMHCYKTFAATTLIANTFEILPEIGRKLPHSVIVEWMAKNDIEPEDVLYAAPDVVKAKLVRLIEYNRPQISHAA
jgi:hypothetical protein